MFLEGHCSKLYFYNNFSICRREEVGLVLIHVEFKYANFRLIYYKLNISDMIFFFYSDCDFYIFDSIFLNSNRVYITVPFSTFYVRILNFTAVIVHTYKRERMPLNQFPVTMKLEDPSKREIDIFFCLQIHRTPCILTCLIRYT